MFQSEHAVRALRQRKIVGCKNRSQMMRPVQALHEFEYRLRISLVQIAGRFVSQEQLRPSHQGPGNRHALLLTAGELARPVFCAIRQANFIKPRPRRTQSLSRRVSPNQQRHCHIFRGGKVRLEAGASARQNPPRGSGNPPIHFPRAPPRNFRRSILYRSWACPAQPADAAMCFFPNQKGRSVPPFRPAQPPESHQPAPRLRFPLSETPFAAPRRAPASAHRSLPIFSVAGSRPPLPLGSSLRRFPPYSVPCILRAVPPSKV